MSRPQPVVEIEAELQLPFATAQIARFVLPDTFERELENPDACRLDMCLTPRPAQVRARLRDRWAAQRFERIGHIYVLPPGEALHIRCVPSVTTSVVCELSAERIADWLDEDLAWSEGRGLATLGLGSPTIRTLLQRLADELRDPGFGHEAMTELIAARVALELNHVSVEAGRAPASGGLAPRRLRLIEERIALAGPAPSLSELARLCNMSVRQLMRSFRASRGCTLGDYIARSRVEFVKQRLQTDDSVKAIARAMGFSSASALTYAFRRVTGVTPRQYRNELIGR
jgi:AraC family transcriptional regulator